MKKLSIWAAALLIVLGLGVPAAAQEADYCFSGEEFPALTKGICLKEIPREGSLMLGSRCLRPGDVLTREMAASMVYCSAAGAPGEITYLPITEEGVLETASFLIPGREDQPPVAEDSHLETYRNISNSGFFRVRDPEGKDVTVTILRSPRRGTVTLEEDGGFLYTPRKNKVGTDSFTFRAEDPQGNKSREATVTISIIKPSDAAGYRDTAGLSCSFGAEWMKNSGIYTAENLGDSRCFQPQKPVTRGEFLVMLLKALDIPGEEALTANMEDIPQWLRPYAAAALRSGLTAGLPRWESFSEEIHQEEAAVLIRNALDLPVPAFRESQEAPSWAAGALAALEGEGLQLGRGILTRGQAAELLYGAHLLKENP